MNEEIVNPKPFEFIIIRRKKSREFTKRTQRDHEETNSRRRKYGILYDQIARILNTTFSGAAKHKELLDFAFTLSMKYNLVVDRLSKRSYQCLLCWYCQYWNIISMDVINYPKILQTVPQVAFTNNQDNNNNNNNSFPQLTHEKRTEPQARFAEEEPPSEPISPILNSRNQRAFNRLPIPSISVVQEKNSDMLTPKLRSNPPKIQLPSISNLVQGDFPFDRISIPPLSSNSMKDATNISDPTSFLNKTVIHTYSENDESDKMPYIPIRFRGFMHS